MIIIDKGVREFTVQKKAESKVNLRGLTSFFGFTLSFPEYLPYISAKTDANIHRIILIGIPNISPYILKFSLCCENEIP